MSMYLLEKRYTRGIEIWPRQGNGDLAKGNRDLNLAKTGFHWQLAGLYFHWQSSTPEADGWSRRNHHQQHEAKSPEGQL